MLPIQRNRHSSFCTRTRIAVMTLALVLLLYSVLVHHSPGSTTRTGLVERVSASTNGRMEEAAFTSQPLLSQQLESAALEQEYFTTHPNYDRDGYTMPSPGLMHASCEAAVENQVELQPIRLGGHTVLTNMDTAPRPEPSQYLTIVLLFHGCHTSMKLWRVGVGERVLLRKLSDAGALLIAFQRRKGMCWDRTPSDDNKDIHQIVDVLVALVAEYPQFRLATLPLASIGVSGGTLFQTMVATYLHFQSIAAYIGPVHASFPASSFRPACGYRAWSALPSPWRAAGAPRVLMHYMPADTKLKRDVTKQVSLMRKHGLHVEVREARAWDVTPYTFHAWLPSRVQPYESVMMFNALAPLFNSTYAPGVTHVRIHVDCLTLRPAILNALQDVVRQRDAQAMVASIPAACCHVVHPSSPSMYVSNGLCSRGDARDVLDLSAQVFPLQDTTDTGTGNPLQVMSIVVRHLLNIARAVHEMNAEAANHVVAFLTQAQ